MSFVETEVKRVLSEVRSAGLRRQIRNYRRFAIGAFIFVVAAYVINFAFVPLVVDKKMPFPLGDAGTWGQFGDFVGGLLNPIIAGFALYFLTESIRIQDSELAETREALLDSAKSQREQVKLQEKMARINALNVIVAALTADSNAARDSIKFVTDQFLAPVQGTRQFYNTYGKGITSDQAHELLGELQRHLESLNSDRQQPIRELRELLGKDYRVREPGDF